jgi:hypothetical protein
VLLSTVAVILANDKVHVEILTLSHQSADAFLD